MASATASTPQQALQVHDRLLPDDENLVGISTHSSNENQNQLIIERPTFPGSSSVSAPAPLPVRAYEPLAGAPAGAIPTAFPYRSAGVRLLKSDELGVTASRLPKVMEHDEHIYLNGQAGSSSNSDEDSHPPPSYPYSASIQHSFSDTDGTPIYTPTSSLTYSIPNGGSVLSSWGSYSGSGRPRVGSGSGNSSQGGMERPVNMAEQPHLNDPRATRPQPLRAISSTYNPQRGPGPRQPSDFNNKRQSSSMKIRTTRRDPNAQYRAQEQKYINTVKQGWPEGDVRLNDPMWGDTSTEDGTDDESPRTEQPGVEFQDDETKMIVEEDSAPTEEDLRNPASRERLEWHSMLASVLQGDVVRQEKQRLIGTTEQKSDMEIRAEIWYGSRAKYYGRPLQMQKKMIDEARSHLGPIIDSIMDFEIKGETVVGKTPFEQVEEIVAKIEKCCWLYPSWKQLEHSQSRAASDAFKASCSAVISWHNVTQTINTELSILQSWVGNQELDFTKQRWKTGSSELTDKSSFVDRILKEDGLKSLQGDESMFQGIGKVIIKAKSTLIENAAAFHERHLPPYIEELLTLINFPSRLIQEIIKVRLSYAKKMKEPAQQSPLIVDQMIAQFQILMKLACAIKQEYISISHPEPGWDLPPCIDENFDATIVEALKFYFKMLNWKLTSNKNTFREAEILEQEWGLSNEIGRQLEGGDVEVAEQFSSLTAKSLARLTTSFEKELRPREDESSFEMEKRYKTILDSVRVRQRKMFRFSRLLGQRFENATEYNLGMDSDQQIDFLQTLAMTGHFLVASEINTPKELYYVAAPCLWNRATDVKAMLGTSFHADDDREDPSDPYILIIHPEEHLAWEGPTMDIELRDLPTHVPAGRLRLVADGSTGRLQAARARFANAIGQDLDIVIEQRANLTRVNTELGKIKKTTFKLSNTIMESVEVVRSQNGRKASPELIQSCFAFATEFGKRSLAYMDHNRRMMNNAKLTKLGLDWVSFICDDCDGADRRTFKWAVAALEFAMAMTRGRNVLDITEEEYAQMRSKVSGCMSVLISHFDIMGARSTLAAQQERSRNEAVGPGRKMDMSKMRNDDECRKQVGEQRLAALESCDGRRSEDEANNVRANLGRVLEGSNEADRSLTYLSSSATNVTMRWQQGQYVGGGTFGSVYEAINLDTGTLMAVKEIRLQDPQLIPTIVKQIGDEMGVLAVLDHPNIVQYFGIEVHRDKVYIFMEYCQGGSLASLLEHGRIEDETIVMVYALQMLEGLAYLHNAHIVHRDIKPENILLDHNGVVKYVDFGAAKIIARQGQTIVQPEPKMTQGGARGNDAAPRAQQGTITGTPMYMSPEVIRGEGAQRFSGAADIWSLGCVLLEMATGRRPWSTLDNEWAIMYNIASGNPPAMPTEDQLSETGLDFLKRCFDRDPKRRSTAAELLQHPWIMEIKRMAGVEEPETPSSSSSGGISLPPSRQNSAPNIR
ncbi:Suppressor of Sensor Kinase (SLN1) [Knufia fluminis]|uniref:MAP kinase kinase kinase n=1 Tax=Knufia fluminis TaxID=191047 RepID=A0AAN8IQJ7_9EURO|nr:Suppressor of Sensor Kinase (SLN1) [Knufia fluminis]